MTSSNTEQAELWAREQLSFKQRSRAAEAHQRGGTAGPDGPCCWPDCILVRPVFDEDKKEIRLTPAMRSMLISGAMVDMRCTSTGNEGSKTECGTCRAGGMHVECYEKLEKSLVKVVANSFDGSAGARARRGKARGTDDFVGLMWTDRWGRRLEPLHSLVRGARAPRFTGTRTCDRTAGAAAARASSSP
jgi:hypothetical protein